MKYCPNRSCRSFVLHQQAAEFLDRAKTCNDCGVPLVAKDMLETDETKAAVRSFYEEQHRAIATNSVPKDRASSARVNLTTGLALLGLSALLLVASYAAAQSTGGGQYWIAIGPAVYGFTRLVRGAYPENH